MQTKVTTLLEFLNSCWRQGAYQKPKRGKPQTYSSMSFLLFFMLMQLKAIHEFAAMHRWAKAHHLLFGWAKSPSRRTIQRRFLALPAVVQQLMPSVAQHCQALDHKTFGHSRCFADKTVFRALGGLWHQKHMLLKVVPHSSIDIQASWAKSEYHGWRFGYGLHLLSNRYRFPLMATLTTASVKDYTLLATLITPLAERIGVVVADSGYFALRFLQAIYQSFSVLVTTPCLFKRGRKLTTFQQYYNHMAGSWAGRLTYQRRKPSIEPVFALLKELTGLSGQTQLPYRGLDRVKSHLLVGTSLLQLIMYDNFTNQRELGSLEAFKTAFQ